VFIAQLSGPASDTFVKALQIRIFHSENGWHRHPAESISTGVAIQNFHGSGLHEEIEPAAPDIGRLGTSIRFSVSCLAAPRSERRGPVVSKH